MLATNDIRLCNQQLGHGQQFIDSEAPSDTKKNKAKQNKKQQKQRTKKKQNKKNKKNQSKCRGVFIIQFYSNL